MLARWVRRFSAVFAAVAVAAPLLAAAQTQSELESQQQELAKEREALQTEISGLREDAIATARKAQDLESELTAIEQRLAELEPQEAAKRAELLEQRAKLAELLAALQRLALQPPESLLITPGAPLDHVRSAMLLGVAVPEIEQRAEALRGELDALAELRADIVEQRAALDTRAEELQAERARLERIVEEKQGLQAKLQSESAEIATRLEKIAEEAEDVEELVVELDKQAEAFSARPTPRPGEIQEAALPPAEETPPEAAPSGPETAGPEAMPAPRPEISLTKPGEIRAFPDSPGGLLTPVRGRIERGYGSKRDNGETIQGLVLTARPAAQVVAPYDGKVAYAGPFRRYGLILIIEHDGRYHTLMAGLERIDAVVGQWVLAGEPVGVMSSREGRNPELYLELRRAGKPVNPLPWIENLNSKAEG